MKQLITEIREGWHCFISDMNVVEPVLLLGWILGASTSALAVIIILRLTQ